MKSTQIIKKQDNKNMTEYMKNYIDNYNILAQKQLFTFKCGLKI